MGWRQWAGDSGLETVGWRQWAGDSGLETVGWRQWAERQWAGGSGLDLQAAINICNFDAIFMSVK